MSLFSQSGEITSSWYRDSKPKGEITPALGNNQHHAAQSGGPISGWVWGINWRRMLPDKREERRDDRSVEDEMESGVDFSESPRGGRAAVDSNTESGRFAITLLTLLSRCVDRSGSAFSLCDRSVASVIWPKYEKNCFFLFASYRPQRNADTPGRRWPTW